MVFILKTVVILKVGYGDVLLCTISGRGLAHDEWSSLIIMSVTQPVTPSLLQSEWHP